MPTAIVWGYILIMQAQGMLPIVDVNYSASEGQRCDDIAAELRVRYPDYVVYCSPTWKPDSAGHARARTRYAHRTVRSYRRG